MSVPQNTCLWETQKQWVLNFYLQGITCIINCAQELWDETNHWKKITKRIMKVVFQRWGSGFRFLAYSAWRFGKPARMKGISPTRPQFGSLLNSQVLPLVLRRTIHWQCHHHLLQNLLRETAGELRWKRGYLQCDHCAVRVVDGARNLVSGICWYAISQTTCNTRPWATARIHRDHPFLQLVTGCFPPEQLKLFQHGIYVHPVPKGYESHEHHLLAADGFVLKLKKNTCFNREISEQDSLEVTGDLSQ